MARTLLFQPLVDLFTSVMESYRKRMLPTNFCQNEWHLYPTEEFLLPVLKHLLAGKVVVPRAKCRYEPITNIRFDVMGGKMINITAGDGKECVEKVLKENAGDKMFAGISIGLNPVLKPNDDYWPVSWRRSCLSFVWK